MKNKEFYDEQTAKRYLRNSVIRYKNAPILITSIEHINQDGILGKEWKVGYNRVGTNMPGIFFLPNPMVNFNPVPLGMMNGIQHTFYVSRAPIRAWKIGLSEENCNFHSVLSDNYPAQENMILSFSGRHVGLTIEGKYPTYKEGLKQLNGETQSVGISRSFAMNKRGLIYKTMPMPVGVCKDTGPKLLEEFAYLEQVMRKELQ